MFQLAKIVRASRAMANRSGCPCACVTPMRLTSDSSPSPARCTVGSSQILKSRARDLPALRFVFLFVILGKPLRKSVKDQLQLTHNVKISEKE
jgi:hypothetical protein